ncbi:MAG: hypothetical protein WC553_03115 [Patescibacteria group bacterium]|jgi:hypothetical protein
MDIEESQSEFVKGYIADMNKRGFFLQILVITLAYAGITYWLNAIRADASLWLVWPLIIVQLGLYIAIFFESYKRAQELRVKWANWIVFVVLGLLGRVNDWEIIVIPITVITMLILSGRRIAKN